MNIEHDQRTRDIASFILTGAALVGVVVALPFAVRLFCYLVISAPTWVIELCR